MMVRYRLGPIFLLVLCIIAALTILLPFTPAIAQNHPFAVGAREAVPASSSGLIGWIIAQQNVLYQAIAHALRASRDNGGFWSIIGFSFGYGVFHAAGPGHGKAVITAYIVANEQALRRGLVLTLAAAMFQGMVAIAIVGGGVLIFDATALTMTAAAQWLERASYLAIALLGLWLLIRKSMALLAVFRVRQRISACAFPEKLQSENSGRFTCEVVDPSHVHNAACTHFHAPDPASLSQNFSWSASLATVVSAGARPCSGAILILVLCLSQNMIMLGISAILAMSLGTAMTTGSLAALAVYARDYALRWGAENQYKILFTALVELIAALVVLLLGATLFATAMRA